MSTSHMVAVVGMVVGAAIGYSLASGKRRGRQVVAQLGLYLVVATFFGLTAAFFAASGRSELSKASLLARGISEAMNCMVYGFVAGAVVASGVILWRRIRRTASNRKD